VRHLVLLFWFLLACAPAVADEPQYVHAAMRSAALSQFWHQPVSVDAFVLLPDSFYKQPQRRYPIFYWIEGFGEVGRISWGTMLAWQHPMRAMKSEFIAVFLNGMFNGGHHEFADSANNGPWGRALTTEFIPQTEAHFRAIATPQTRFVGGHSSGGWSALWLQVTYPDLFGGEWSLAPDPVDFRDFTGPDLTREPPQNFYHGDNGRAYELDGTPLRSFVVGEGWERLQFESFDAVFSPRGTDGKPQQLFDRKSGAIDPQVEQYWEDHYDIAHILRANWPQLGLELHHKLHIIVGMRDQYHLDRPVALLAGDLKRLGSDAEIDFAPGLAHSTIFNWKGGAIGYILAEARALAPP